MNPLEDALVKARETLLSGPLSEAQVSRGPISLILQALGWNTFDVNCVFPEYSVGQRRVDYALKARPSTTDVFLEVKAPGRADDAADQQLFEYASKQGVPFAVLTDGKVWNFYLPSGQGNYQDRRLFKLDIVERGLDESCERLKRYLGFDRIKNGVARSEAAKEYEERFQKNLAKELIPKVWRSMLSEPDDLLCDALIEGVEAEGGLRPLREDVADFLRSAANFSFANGRATTTPAPRKEQATPQQSQVARSAPPSVVGGIGFRFGDGSWQRFTNGKQCYVAIIARLVKEYPDFALRFQNAKTRGKRAWIARSKDELFPGRIDFQESEVTDVGSGWFVGTQMSALVEMPKRVEAACACVGLVFGRNISATFL